MRLVTLPAARHRIWAAVAGIAGFAVGARLAGLGADAYRAYLLSLPLIEMAQARARILAGGAGQDPTRLNAFVHAGDLASPASTSVTAPNADTLYSTAFVDLTRGPVRLQVPDPAGRYLSVAVLDMWTDAAAVLGARTRGGPGGDWRLLGPGRDATGPRDLPVSTPHAWVLARLLVDGDDDLGAARRLQDALILSGPDVAAPPILSDRHAPWPAYFRSAAALLSENPPAFTAGRRAFARLRAAGRHGDFSRSGYSLVDATAIDLGIAAARALVAGARGRQRFIDGWSYPPAILAAFGENTAMRAVVAVAGLGALPTEEAMYLRAEGDTGSTRFSGDGPWRLRLDRPPPVDGFWSLTLYETPPDGSLRLTPNALGRYALGDRTPGLVRAHGGAIEIWIARDDPGGARTACWLPAPARGAFALILRAYLPRAELRDGRYRLPRVEKARASTRA